MKKIFGNNYPETLNELCIMEIEKPGEYKRNLLRLYRIMPADCDDKDFLRLIKWIITAHKNRLPHVFVAYSETLFISDNSNGIYLSLIGAVSLIKLPNDISNELHSVIGKITNCTGEEFTWAT